MLCNAAIPLYGSSSGPTISHGTSGNSTTAATTTAASRRGA